MIRVEWDYLQGIMVKLGFHPPFIERVMMCVKSVSFSVKMNGERSASMSRRSEDGCSVWLSQDSLGN
jgi:hypothetical protein